MIDCVIYLVVNESGEYGVGCDYGAAVESYDQDMDNSPVRVVKLIARVPNIVSEVKASVPAFKDAEVFTPEVEKV